MVHEPMSHFSSIIQH